MNRAFPVIHPPYTVFATDTLDIKVFTMTCALFTSVLTDLMDLFLYWFTYLKSMSPESLFFEAQQDTCVREF